MHWRRGVWRRCRSPCARPSRVSAGPRASPCSGSVRCRRPCSARNSSSDMPRSHPHPAQKQGPNAGSSRVAVPRQWVTLSIAKTEVADFSVRLLQPPEVLDLIAYIAYLSLWWSRLHYLEAGKRHVSLHCYFTFTLYRFPKRYNTRSYFTCAQKLTCSRTVNFIFHCKNMKSGSWSPVLHFYFP